MDQVTGQNWLKWNDSYLFSSDRWCFVPWLMCHYFFRNWICDGYWHFAEWTPEVVLHLDSVSFI